MDFNFFFFSNKGSMRPTHYDALAEFLQYNCYALQELNLLGIWINGYKLCEPMKKLRQIRHLAVPFIGPLFSVLNFGSFPIYHMTYLKLRRK